MAIMHRELQYLPAVRGRQSQRGERVGAIAVISFVCIGLWIAYRLITATVSWGSVKLDDIRYGYPRTFQTDGYIGYREQGGVPTHFTVVNAHRQILILIVPGSNPAHVTVIKGPYLVGSEQEYSPATVELVDRNHDGFPDLRLHVDGQTITYLNDPRRHTFLIPHSAEGAH